MGNTQDGPRAPARPSSHMNSPAPADIDDLKVHAPSNPLQKIFSFNVRSYTHAFKPVARFCLREGDSTLVDEGCTWR